MKRQFFSLVLSAFPFLAGHAAVISVTTTNNADPSLTSLSKAISQLQDGDSIEFNIPGPGPHYIATPDEGYPIIRANNVHINGYTQPGSHRNTNGILATNNAVIDIVLDSRAGGYTPMNTPLDPADDPGYGDDEGAVLGFFSTQNFRVEGLSIISVPAAPDGSAIYGFALEHGASGQIAGCWIGLDPNGQDVAGPANAVSGFRYQEGGNPILVNDVVIGVAKNATNSKGDFNVIIGEPSIPIIIEGNNTRISGNFLMVFPDGLHDYNVAFIPEFVGLFEGAIEIGRGGDNTLIGTDGDGLNDADERNVIGGTLPPNLGGYDHTIEFYQGNPTNVVVAGNYIGIGVDGATRFTNGVPALNASRANASYRFGSDFNGVSDTLEGNVVANNWPAQLFADTPPEPQSMNFFDELDVTSIASVRGNVLIDNFSAPASPLRQFGGEDGGFLTVYMAKVLDNPDLGITPIIDTNSTTALLIGNYPLPNSTFTNVMIDLYIADPEGLTNGLALSGGVLTNGFVQGKQYLKSFNPAASPAASPVAGKFNLDISGLSLTNGTLITLTANYSQAAPGATNDIALTSSFSDPFALLGGTTSGIKISSITNQNGNLVLTWTGGSGPFIVQKKINVNDSSWTTATNTTDHTATITIEGEHAFFRVAQ